MTTSNKLQNWPHVPPSLHTVRVRMVDTTSVMAVHAEAFVKPVMPGHEVLSFTNVAFLIENERRGKKAMFDLGVRKDFWNSPPGVSDRIATAIPGLKVDKDVTEILNEAGIELEDIDDIIWSHSHWDHVGSAYKFPKTTNLLYGKDMDVLTRYPSDPKSPLDEAHFKGRKSIAVDFDNLIIAGFPAYDFYSDGSLYLLDSPGHWPGHMCALARTTPDTFLLLGGDICHFPGDFRPNEDSPLPDPIPEVAFKQVGIHSRRQAIYPTPCPCSLFADHHPQNFNIHASHELSRVDTSKTPFYNLSTHQHSSYRDPAVATASMRRMQKEFDSDPNVLVCLAHDPSLLAHLPTLNTTPERDMNDWKQLDMKERCRWGWLTELPRYDRFGNVIGPGMREAPLVMNVCKGDN